MEKDMRFGTWIFRSLCRVSATKSVAPELKNYKLYLVVVKEFRWGREVIKQQTNIDFCVEREC
jgi:hypothetical protein